MRSTKGLVSYQLSDASDRSVTFEVSDQGGDYELIARADEEVAKAAKTLEGAIDSIRDAADNVMGMFERLSHTPETVELEFGIRMTGKAGAVIASLEGEVHFHVTMTWKNSRREK